MSGRSKKAKCQDCNAPGAVLTRSEYELCIQCDVKRHGEITGSHKVKHSLFGSKTYYAASNIENIPNTNKDRSGNKNKFNETDDKHESTNSNESQENEKSPQATTNTVQTQEPLQNLSSAQTGVQTEITLRGLQETLLSAINEHRRETSTLHKEMVKMRDELKAKDKTIQNLEAKVKVMENKIDVLSDKMDDIDREKRSNNAIIHGLDVKSFAEAIETNRSTGDDTQPHDPDATINRFLNFTQKLGAPISKSDVNTIVFMKKRNTHEKAPILVKFNNNIAKASLFKKKKGIKDHGYENMFINDDLTPKNVDLIKKARGLKKKGNIENAWTRDGRVYLKKHDGSIVTIRKEDQLNQFAKNGAQSQD